MLRAAYSAALASLLKGRSTGPVIILSINTVVNSSSTPALRFTGHFSFRHSLQRRDYAESRITVQIPLAADSCSAVQAVLSPASAAATLQAAGFPPIGSVSIQFFGCSAALAALPAELQRQVDATTSVVVLTVAGVVGSSVAVAAAGAMGMSFSAAAAVSPMPGASVYQLINAVQVPLFNFPDLSMYQIEF